MQHDAELTMKLTSRETVQVSDARHACRLLRAHIRDGWLGASELAAVAGRIYRGKKHVMTVRYNGTVEDVATGLTVYVPEERDL